MLRAKESKQSIKSAVLIFLNTIQKVFEIFHFLEKENFRVTYIHGTNYFLSYSIVYFLIYHFKTSVVIVCFF
jgi:hypothetical protein